MHLFLSTKKSRYSIWRSDLHERHKLLLKTGVDSFTGHPVYQIIPSLIHFILSVNGVNFYVILNVGKKIPNFLYWFHLYISCWIWKVKHVLVIRSRAKLFCRAANDPSVFTITEKALSRAFSWLKAPTSAFIFVCEADL